MSSSYEFKQKAPHNYGAATQSRQGSIDLNSPSIAAGRATAGITGSPSTFYFLHGKDCVEVLDHCHRSRAEGVDVKARRKLIIASVLCLAFMICEIIGGVLSNSLAIATDAAHLLTDFASFMISLFAIWIAGRPSTQRMSFGWYRAEVIGALASVIMIWVITAILVLLAINRVITKDYEINAPIMLITSGLAIVVNLIMGCQLHHGHSHGHSHGHESASVHEHIQTSDAASQVPAKFGKAKQHATTKNTASTDTEQESDNVDGKVEAFHSATICPASPSARIEDGVTAEPETSLPAAGLQTFSYQNTQMQHDSIDKSTPHLSAIKAEHSPGKHQHGGRPAQESQNMNVRAAYIHVLGDIIQSAGVFIAAIVIYLRPDWVLIDPICTFVFSIIVLFTTFNIMKDALLVLMEGTPSYLAYNEVVNTFMQIEGVEHVHNLRIWQLSINKIALSAHLAIRSGVNPKNILDEANRVVHLRYNFFETTIQIEDFTPQMDNCTQCVLPIE